MPKVPRVPRGWCLVLVPVPVLVPVSVLFSATSVQAPFSNVVESAVDHGTQIKGLVTLVIREVRAFGTFGTNPFGTL